MRPWLLVLTLAGLLLGCPPTATNDDDDSAATDDDDVSDLPLIPDPGDAVDDWALDLWDEPCCGTPETAYPVGTVTMNAGYIQGVIDADLQFFYVFRAHADLTEFSFPLWFEEVHLHEGAGLRFGDVIEPTSSDGNSATWAVEGDGIYVVEISSANEGFF